MFSRKILFLIALACSLTGMILLFLIIFGNSSSKIMMFTGIGLIIFSLFPLIKAITSK